jgi:hypothetical protein
MYAENKKENLSFEMILVLDILNSSYICKLTFLSIEGPFFFKMALVKFFTDNFLSMKCSPIFSSVQQPSVIR